MPRPIVRSFLILAGALTLFLTAGLWISPDVAQARPPCDEPYGCECGAERQTPQVWGMGADCATAFQDAIAHAQALFTCQFDSCSETFVITTGCWFNGTQQQVDGYMLYRCLEGCSIDPCDEEPLPKLE